MEVGGVGCGIGGSEGEIKAVRVFCDGGGKESSKLSGEAELIGVSCDDTLTCGFDGVLVGRFGHVGSD